jgi:NADPH2:quinone reductase
VPSFSTIISFKLTLSQVIGVCGGAEKSKLVKSYGAYETIDYSHEDVRNKVKQLTGGDGVDIVVDVVGGKLLEDCLRW